MGCDCSTLKEDSLIANEDLILTYETGLGWKSGCLQQLLVELQGLETDLSARQLAAILTQLQVRLPDFRDCASPVTHLYASLKTKKLYSQRKLVLLAVLLGAGKALEATELLETLYQLDAATVDIAALAADACELALISLPVYVGLELELAQDCATLSKLATYLEKLKQGRAEAVRQLRKAIAREESCIRQGDLRERLQETGSLLTTRMLRKTAVSRPKRRPARLNSILKTPVASPLTSPPTSQRSVRFLLDSAEPTE